MKERGHVMLELFIKFIAERSIRRDLELRRRVSYLVRAIERRVADGDLEGVRESARELAETFRRAGRKEEALECERALERWERCRAAAREGGEA